MHKSLENEESPEEQIEDPSARCKICPCKTLSKFSSMIWITIAGVSEAYISAM
ncbi:hypothetical protein IRJ41_006034 [Triplophysa rosa]|uniref:Uncharacterized protein n=1 Tax=Triplophysa rosa TaxID=992332 RepID=A0A9W7T783_TRIRA|nr:hypothetical protein IRJ41_006034 [Triplophysa rosa]